MADYWGLEAICERMGWRDSRAPVRQMVKNGFLMYQRRRGKHPRRIWYTNENLVGLWETTMAKLQREALLRRMRERNEHE